MYDRLETKWTKNTASSIYKDALNIRYQVFVLEQGVSVEEEIDELEDQTHHAVVFIDDQPVATARLYNLGNKHYKVQRVAVQKNFRRKGLGAYLMKQVEQKVIELAGDTLTLGAQNTAIPFYETIGYSIKGHEFLDAGIPHHSMIKELSSDKLHK